MINNLEVRENNGTFKIGGYINSVERNSNILRDKEGRSFIEIVKAGVFKEALDEAKKENRDIPLMYRHKEIITKNVSLKEDAIGLRFEAEVNEEIYNMVKEENLQCSFGFTKVKDSIKNITQNLYQRTLEKIKLFEVTITPNPAYNGSLVECREGENFMRLEELLKLREELDVEIERLTNLEKVVEKPEEVVEEVVEVKEQEEKVDETGEEVIKEEAIQKDLERMKRYFEYLKLK
ncbi:MULTISPECIES: HK97 family phage prohead protease [Clostridium]|jgi:HK97 family phage prohead protease|uniref:HK97 family phage prohead protease n=1 Tax=Clostridium TaxID=1485 RepID=UPI000509BC8F|nr:HK97 family phage prohead protease [Clostridium saudiense]